jgi:hypothetical protein
MQPGRPAGRLVGLDKAQRALERDCDALRAGADRRRGHPFDRRQIERAAVGAEPAQPRFDHRLSGETGMLDGPADQDEAQPGLAARGHQTAAVPGRGQHERVRHPVVAGENSALAAGRSLEQVRIDAARLERATRAGAEPSDTDGAAERASEAAAPSRAHIARHAHLLPRAEAEIEGCNFERAHCWYRSPVGS